MCCASACVPALVVGSPLFRVEGLASPRILLVLLYPRLDLSKLDKELPPTLYKTLGSVFQYNLATAVHVHGLV